MNNGGEFKMKATPNEIVAFLDTAAGRVDMCGGHGASGKQTWLLASLMSDQGWSVEDAMQEFDALTSKNASSWINMLKDGDPHARQMAKIKDQNHQKNVDQAVDAGEIDFSDFDC